jgi:hypothetical protein
MFGHIDKGQIGHLQKEQIREKLHWGDGGVNHSWQTFPVFLGPYNEVYDDLAISIVPFLSFPLSIFTC